MIDIRNLMINIRNHTKCFKVLYSNMAKIWIGFPPSYSNGMHNLIRSMVEVSALQRPFIDGVLFQIDSLLPIIQDTV